MSRENAKTKFRQTLLGYLSDPAHAWLDRNQWATIILGKKNKQSLWSHFTSDELFEIEREAVDIRRQRLASTSAKVDDALFRRAIETGDPAACRLFYSRHEGWSEKSTMEMNGKFTVASIATLVMQAADDLECEVINGRFEII